MKTKMMIVLVLACALLLCACSSNVSEGSPIPSPTPTSASTTPTDPQPTVPAPVVNEFRNENNNILEENNITVRPLHVYWEGDVLIAKCFVINGFTQSVGNLNIERLVFSNASGTIAEAAFGMLENAVIGSHEHIIWTFRFAADHVSLPNADLSSLSCTSRIGYEFVADRAKAAGQTMLAICTAEDAAGAAPWLTENSVGSAQNLADHYPGQQFDVTVTYKGSADGYDVFHYELTIGATGATENGYTVMQWKNDRYLLCVHADTQNAVMSHFVCTTCAGSGQIAAGGQITCAICGGTGTQYIPNAYFDPITNLWQGQYMGCSGCGGSGQIAAGSQIACPTCAGSGWDF